LHQLPGVPPFLAERVRPYYPRMCQVSIGLVSLQSHAAPRPSVPRHSRSLGQRVWESLRRLHHKPGSQPLGQLPESPSLQGRRLYAAKPRRTLSTFSCEIAHAVSRCGQRHGGLRLQTVC